MTDSTDTILEARGKVYGAFDDHAEISQGLKLELNQLESWNRLDADQKEALEMICHKMARIMNGDPDYVDNWADIAGYARLVAKRLEKNAK